MTDVTFSTLEAAKEHFSGVSSPTVGDLEKLLALVGEPGKNRIEKKELVYTLFPNAQNFQGVHIAESLTGYGSY